jgi:hypothetical protein
MQGNVWEMVRLIPTTELDTLAEHVRMEQSRRKGTDKINEINAKGQEEQNVSMNRQMAQGGSANPYAALSSQDSMNINRQMG